MIIWESKLVNGCKA